MNANLHRFLKAVLGDDAATALKKAADRSDSLSTVLGARAIVGWLGLAARWNYEGEVPGNPGSYLRFAKSEGGLFSGEVRFGKNAHEFTDVDLPYVAAGLSVALGADEAPDEDLRDGELAALGDNIDLLLKTQVIKLSKAEDEESSKTCYHCDQGSHHRCKDDDCDCCGGKPDLKKFGTGTTAPGEPAEQKPPAGPVDGGFTAPKATQPKRSKKKGPGLTLKQSEANARCSVCDRAQFKGDRFLGCYCTEDLAKHATSTPTADGGFHIDLDPAFWGQDEVSLLMNIVEGK
jgi:hypothetical protein